MMTESGDEIPLEKTVEELKKVIRFKDTIEKGDVVLVAGRNPQFFIYAYVNDITRDDSKKDEWWFVTLHFLSLPVQKTSWLLRIAQMTGMEIFTMDGAERFMKAIDFDTDNRDDQQRKKKTVPIKKTQLRVVK